MAPYCLQASPEVDVFSEPHARMKQLVLDYSTELENADFSDFVCMNHLLHSLRETFLEFKNHELIENKLIMSQLKNKLKQCKVHSTAVCNCHEDDHLNDILKLVSDGYEKKSMTDRINYGRQLKSALLEFNESFLPHMKEEEEIFQPLLLEYFSYEELCDLKKTVLQQHHLKLKEKSGDFEKKVENDVDEDSIISIDDMPTEILMEIFSQLNLKDLLRCLEVSRVWNGLVYDSSFWREIHPIQWSMGNWNYKFDNKNFLINEEDHGDSNDKVTVQDDDADVDESYESENYELVLKESKILSGLCKYVLPKVGHHVKTVNLAYGRSVTNTVVSKILRNCPNMVILDLTSTQITDSAFKRFSSNGFSACLKYLNLSGCTNISDLLFISLALSQMQYSINNDPEYKNRYKQSLKIPLSVVNKYRDSYEFLKSCYYELQKNYSCKLDMYSTFQSVEKTLSFGLSPKNFTNLENRFSKWTIHSPSIRGKKTGLHTSSLCHTVCDSKDNSYSDRTKSLTNISRFLTVSDNAERNISFNLAKSLEYLNISGCLQITDVGLKALMICGKFHKLKFLNLSGLCHITSKTLHDFINLCPRIDPELFYYCDNIVDGPLAEVANGCQTVNCPNRYCCRKGN